MMLLENRVALVTGAARGLGWGIARAFGLAGARVCVTDIGDDELVEVTPKSIRLRKRVLRNAVRKKG
mgnify:CR=1 FL=1